MLLAAGSHAGSPFRGWTALQVLQVEDPWSRSYSKVMHETVSVLNNQSLTGLNQCAQGKYGYCYMSDHIFISGSDSTMSNALNDEQQLAESGTQSHVIVLLVQEISALVKILELAEQYNLLNSCALREISRLSRPPDPSMQLAPTRSAVVT